MTRPNRSFPITSLLSSHFGSPAPRRASTQSCHGLAEKFVCVAAIFGKFRNPRQGGVVNLDKALEKSELHDTTGLRSGGPRSKLSVRAGVPMRGNEVFEDAFEKACAREIASLCRRGEVVLDHRLDSKPSARRFHQIVAELRGDHLVTMLVSRDCRDFVLREFG